MSSSSRTNAGHSKSTKSTKRSWATALRGPWTVAATVVTVVIGPAAVTASALDRANAAPPHQAPERPENTPGHNTPHHRFLAHSQPTAAVLRPRQSLKRSQSFG